MKGLKSGAFPTYLTKFKSTIESPQVRNAAGVFLIFALIYAPGYMYFFSAVGFANDDFSSFRHAISGNGILTPLEPLWTWFQGRPLGHTFWRLQHYLFAPYPTGVYQLWCGLLIITYSVVAYRVLRHLTIAKAPAIFGASVLGLAPFAQSIYLPVHASATEFSTLLFLLSMLFAFAGKPIKSAICICVSFLFYEHMLPFIWLPGLVFLWKAWEQNSSVQTFVSVKAQSKTFQYALVFVLLAAAIFIFRNNLEVGRESSSLGYSLSDL